ncbi:MAG TPA: alpha/beta hydrolase-fold protein [Gammaproteobacteria bacterium]|nr:alpha/beta hydrolase-fold protein [Gammaproteobacteria bacterium]
MALKRPSWPAGRVVTLEHTSKVLADNPLGDPHVRTLDVWLPPQYDGAKGRGLGRRFPVLFDLVGFTGSGRMHTAWRNFDENVPERAARLVHDAKMAPAIIVFPDCFTAFGGNQYVNSPAVGRYADYLTRELVPFVDRELRTLAAREHRGVFGKSSGGYGALVHAMKYPKCWGAAASHSGDAGFETLYAPEWPSTLDELANYREPPLAAGERDVRAAVKAVGYDGVDDGRVMRFLARMWTKRQPSTAEIHALTNIAMAATYDPDPKALNGFRVPFHFETGERLPQRWQRWLRHDPVNLVARYAASLRTLRGLSIDCGWRDQYRIHYGSRLLSLRLTEHRVPHVYEEFDGTHSGVDYRMDRSLPFLTHALR